MKNFKLLLTSLITIVSVQVSAQINVLTQNTSAPFTCDGSACLDSTASNTVSATSIYWAGGGAVLQQGGYCIYNLCSGTYTVTYTINGTSMTSTFTIGSGSGNPCNSLTANLTIQPSSTASACDGTATCTPSGGSAPYTYQWSNGETPNTASNLCAGSYICCYVTDANGCTTTACDSISNQGQSTGGGDTLIISGNGGCNNPVGSVLMQIEDCNFDFNAVDTAFLSTVVLGSTAIDSALVLWVFVDTNGVSTTITSVSPGFNANGCYDYTLILFCSQKSMNIKYIFVNGQYTYQSSGIET
ncbi:MAG: SprB repeat-containing protein, partial [Crocinitomicaceae bacterium]